MGFHTDRNRAGRTVSKLPVTVTWSPSWMGAKRLASPTTVVTTGLGRLVAGHRTSPLPSAAALAVTVAPAAPPIPWLSTKGRGTVEGMQTGNPVVAGAGGLLGGRGEAGAGGRVARPAAAPRPL